MEARSAGPHRGDATGTGASMDGNFFSAVVASIGDGVLVVDCDGTVVCANPAAEELLGTGLVGTKPPEWSMRLLATDARSAGVASDWPPAKAALGEPAPARDFVVQGSETCVSIASRPLHDGAGRLIGSVSVVRDVTELRRAEEDLEKARTFLNSIVENIPDMIFVKEAEDLRFELFNRAGEELLGIPRDHLVGKTDYDFFPAEQAEFFQTRDRQTLREGGLVDIQEEPIDTARGRRWLHTKKIPIRDERGEVKYLLGISSDITARRTAEEALMQAHEELEGRVVERTEELRRTEEALRHAQKLEAVGRLAGGVAHDFNNVLAVILGHVGLMEQRAPVGDAVRAGLDSIRAAAEHAATLTRQLLAFSRKQVMQPRLINLNRIVEQARAMLTRLLGEDIAVVTRLSPDVGNIHADPALIEQVFVNLAVNARDAMPNGGELTILTQNLQIGETSARRAPELPPGLYVELTISDTGIGMDADTRARIFEPFFTTKGPGQGTGLGLSMAYGVVAQSGGTIQVDSAPGRGTSFHVILPVAPGKRSMTPPPGPVATLHGGSETILVAEDEAPLRHIVRSVLEQAGYLVLEAANGEEALDVSSQHQGPIDLLVTDVVMPLMDGPLLAKALRRSRPTTRVLFMTGYADDRLAAHSLEGAAFAPLAKPFTVETLTARVRAALDGR